MLTVLRAPSVFGEGRKGCLALSVSDRYPPDHQDGRSDERSDIPLFADEHKTIMNSTSVERRVGCR